MPKVKRDANYWFLFVLMQLVFILIGVRGYLWDMPLIPLCIGHVLLALVGIPLFMESLKKVWQRNVDAHFAKVRSDTLTEE